MKVGALPQVQQSYSLRSSDILTKSADGIGNMLPPGNSGENVDISEGGRLVLEREMRNIAEARDNQELIDFWGRDGQVRLGLMALGQSAINDWSSKGLELNEESILAAAEAFQSAFRKNLEENGPSTAGSSIALNRHQIVINSQAVPDWFVEEYQYALSLMGTSKVKSAFENGDTFYVSQPSVSSSEALSRYAAVNNSI
jgi:hypothetical protein